jgi:hypothetical protein
MLRALVVYESVFGDARTIAHAIADGLSVFVPADVVAAADAPAEMGPDVGLLVVGGPNHAFGMPRPSTRENAVEQYGADIPDTRTGLHEWLEAVRVPRSRLAAAAFDTRGSGHPVLTRMDHSARTEEKLLGKLGAEVVAPPSTSPWPTRRARSSTEKRTAPADGAGRSPSWSPPGRRSPEPRRFTALQRDGPPAGLPAGAPAARGSPAREDVEGQVDQVHLRVGVLAVGQVPDGRPTGQPGVAVDDRPAVHRSAPRGPHRPAR